MLKKFLNWYKATQASKKELEKWTSVAYELTEAFQRNVDGIYVTDKFCDTMAEKFFSLYREGKIN